MHPRVGIVEYPGRSISGNFCANMIALLDMCLRLGKKESPASISRQCLVCFDKRSRYSFISYERIFRARTGSKFASEYTSTNQRQLEPCPDRKDGANAAIPYERHMPFRPAWHAHLSNGIKLQFISFRHRLK